MSGWNKFVVLLAVLILIHLITFSAALAGAPSGQNGREMQTSSAEIVVDSQNQNQKSLDPEKQSPLPAEQEHNKVITGPGPKDNDPPAAEKAGDEQKLQTDQDIMETALDLLDESQNYWVKGDLEKALDLLDQTYSLILDTNGEPDISRQKDDLRLLIAKRILAIYTSMQTVTAGKHGEIPIVMNADVEKEIKLFQTFERDFFIQSYQRSGIYRPTMLRELKSAGLPEELSWLPLVESGFKIQALSRARALGLWQFIPSTGYKYGLNRDEWVDERMDVEKSTKAAIGYLNELHNMFGDWLTVLAAYNCGEGRVLKEISRQHINYLDRFWDLYHQLPYETARYVPRFLATLHIIRDPKKYGIELNQNIEMPSPLAYEVVKTAKPMRLTEIAQRINTPEETLNILNAELRHKVTPNREYNLKVPPEMAEKLVSVVDEIPEWQPPRHASPGKRLYIKHRVKSGETIASIARRYGTSTRTITALNRLSAKKGVHAGQRLTVPLPGRNRSAKVSAERQPDKITQQANATTKYRVKKGETLTDLAQRFNMTVPEIKKINRLKGDRVNSGRIIRVARQPDDRAKDEAKQQTARKPAVEKNKTYTVKKGDNLYRIARENNVSVSKLMELNSLAGKEIRPGQVIVVK